MSVDARLLECLYSQEIYFVDEIDRILTTPESVALYPNDALLRDGGWLFMAGESASGDWNIARMIGSSKVALSSLDLLPAVETYLLVPEAETAMFTRQFKQLSGLLYFVSNIAGNSDRLPLSNDKFVNKGVSVLQGHLPEGADADVLTGDMLTIGPGAEIARELASKGFSVKISYSHKTIGNLLQPDFAIYLLADDQVQGYVKTIRATRNFVEVYIEIKPALRGRGLATRLLELAVMTAHQQGRELIYVVDEQNKASVATVISAGLTRTISLSRFLRQQ